MDQQIGYLFKLITDRLKVRGDADLKKHGLTLTQSRVISYLEEKNDASTQKEIENFLDVSHPTVVGIISRLEQNGFITTWFDPADKRNKMVKLTEKGVQTGREIKSVIHANDVKMLSSLSENQILELEKYLKIIYENISND
ncbi:MAG: MarR family winged helix-turn-helix transcriptional regulator [Eubacterium sp.]